jgi:hypothetical protein
MNAYFYEICGIVFAVLLAGSVGLALSRSARPTSKSSDKPRAPLSSPR